ncbi:transglycosylase SLT domain-containing protein [Candidatus Berkelbacteria bacterium]|nr:transglycosylase SLT domain-containing protein [Candidatus Berkelbacteria bacterium]
MAGANDEFEKKLVVFGVVIALPSTGLVTLVATVAFGLMASLTANALPSFKGTGPTTSLDAAKCADLVPESVTDYQGRKISRAQLMEAVSIVAGERKLPAALIAAGVKAESSFNPNAGSSVGARGIYQIMPETYDGINGNRSWERAKQLFPAATRDPRDAYYVMYLGSGYLRTQYDRVRRLFSGKTENELYKLAYAAYNAGPGAVEDYREPPHNGIPPYDETERYVKRIMEGLDGEEGYYPAFLRCQNQEAAATTGTRIYLHWTAGAYDAQSGAYTYNILANGTVIETNGNEHTFARNSNGIGISVTAMSGGNHGCYNDLYGSGCPTPVTKEQMTAMVQLAAELAVKHNIPVDVKHIMTHGEAASLRDYDDATVQEATKACGVPASETDSSKFQCYADRGLPHENYGPYNGGPSMRWEFYKHEDELRAMIKAKADSLKAAGKAQ